MKILKRNMFYTIYTPITDECKKISKIKKWTGHLSNFVKNNKIITLSICIFFIFLTFNFVLIYNFLKILESAY